MQALRGAGYQGSEQDTQGTGQGKEANLEGWFLMHALWVVCGSVITRYRSLPCAAHVSSYCI
jgi:hypothetical protein